MQQPDGVHNLGSLWGRRVRARREGLGLSQQELARRCAVTQQTISKIEVGAVLPRDVLKLELAQQLEISPRTLFPWPATGVGPGAATRRGAGTTTDHPNSAQAQEDHL